jgi:hypothetical protein
MNKSDAQGVNYINPMKRIKDVLGRMKVSIHQNVYEADFEYSKQPLRWDEAIIAGTGPGTSTITQLPAYGGVAMYLSSNVGDVTIRQSRPYHRYQPGKSMFMATAINFGTTNANQFQRAGFFDDANGVFFQQNGAQGANPANPYGVSVVYRSDVPTTAIGGTLPTAGSTAVDVVVDLTQWSDPQGIASSLNWSNIQMLWIEYAWYGAGAVRWGVYINGEAYILHEIGFGNNSSSSVPTIGAALNNNSNVIQYAAGNGSGQQLPWARTGNLPVRFEQRNVGSSVANTMFHYGVSVVVEGKRDEQRGFTYSYGMSPAAPRRYVAPNTTRFPVLSVQARPMGTQELGTSTLAVNGITYFSGNPILNATQSGVTFANSTLISGQFAGRGLYYLATDGNFYTARITTNSTSGLSFTDVIAPVAPTNITGGIIIPNTGFAFSGSMALGSNNILFSGGTLPVTGAIISHPYLPFATKVISTSGTVTNGTGVLTNSATTAITAAIPAYANQAYVIGQINRGQLLPQQLLLSSDSLSVVELIASTPSNPTLLTGAAFVPLNNLGSYQSFGARDVNATGILNNANGASAGEVVYAFTTPAGGAGLQIIDLSFFFPLYNTIRGNAPDILTVAVTTKATNTPIPPVTSGGATINSTTLKVILSSPHGLNIGDLVTLSGWSATSNPAGLNATFTVVSLPDANTFTVTLPSSSTPAGTVTVGTTTAQIGSNVGAHLIVQEAMS